MKTQTNRPAGKLSNPEQLSKSNVTQILNDENISLKDLIAPVGLTPSQSLVVSVFKQHPGNYIHTYIFRKEGSSHPAQRISELIDKGAIIERYTDSAIDQSGVEHSKVGYYRLKGWKKYGEVK